MNLEQSTQQQQLRQSDCISGQLAQNIHDISGLNQECDCLTADKVQLQSQPVAYVHDSAKDVFIATKSILQLNQPSYSNNSRELTQNDVATDKIKIRAQSLRQNLALKLPKIKEILQELNDHQIEKAYREHIGGKGPREKFRGFWSKPIIALPLRRDIKIMQEAKQKIREQKEQLIGPFKMKRTQTGIVKGFLPSKASNSNFLSKSE